MTTDKGKAAALAAPPADDKTNLPWIEKYRPVTLDDVAGQEGAISTVRKFVSEGRIPHMLFYGPPGTGKTSTIQAIAREIFGPNYRNSVLELNASDDRGIDVVRDQIKTFASTRQMFSSGFKLIILDEADAMTNVAQNALRRIIEKYTAHTRFCILANYTHKLNPALVSRCTRFRFSPLADEAIAKRVTYVVEQEKINLTPKAFQSLVVLARGDMRRALNVLQACFASVEAGQEITEEMVYDCIGSPRPSDIQLILNSVLNDEWSTALHMFNEVKQKKGLALADILTSLTVEFAKLDLKNEARIYLLQGLSEIEWRLSGGGNETIQSSATVGLIKHAMELQA
ncbi:replication factor C subunit 3 [Trichomonascus vanleenenianus]|uniref:replication factor C subunit 3 n=1 Tax=Trichomonascus vanleenenianus TaxID=2268995 RepID=UPI003EC9BA42